MAKTTYKDAGVDLDVYEESMSRLGPLMRRTYSPRVLPIEGGFAGLCRLDFNSPLFSRKYTEPVLVSCTDGVGTKLKVACLAGKHDTVGIDLVAMCVNDALCYGAEPLMFLDYVAMPKDDSDLLEQIVRGISNGCVDGDCALVGGETAILPDLYAAGDYDLAGFCVGVVEKKRIIDGSKMQPGDVAIGLASTGLHSNGYSLARKIVFDVAKLDIHAAVPELGQTVAEALLTPTRIYAQPLRTVLRHYRVKQVVHGIAHITGGGLRENLVRIVPPNRKIVVKNKSWPVPPVFDWLQKLGEVEDAEMERVFNMGIGFVLVVAPTFADSIIEQLDDCGVSAWRIGEVHEHTGEPAVEWA
ncbi:MAG TPA: phosphoribosylformylglycinamidine cyclo-ligase [Pirellulales bacterium]